MKFCKLILIFLLMFTVSSMAQESDDTDGVVQLTAEEEQHLKSPRRAVVHGMQLIDEGDFESAVKFLSAAVVKYPKNDTLLFNLGVAYYESLELVQSEFYFRQAVIANPLNANAKAYVNAIRDINDAAESVQSQHFREVFWDKFGDVVVFALGYFFGSLMSNFFKAFNEARFIRRSRRAFLKGQYDNFADLLEIQLSTNELKPLRDSLAFMLEERTLEESLDILNSYVNTHENLQTLTRMLKLNVKTMSP